MAIIGFIALLVSSAYLFYAAVVMRFVMAALTGKGSDKLAAFILFAISIVGFYFAFSNAPFTIRFT